MTTETVTYHLQRAQECREMAQGASLSDVRRLHQHLADLHAGATGSMTGGGFPDGIRPIIEAFRTGDTDERPDLRRCRPPYRHWRPRRPADRGSAA